MLNSFVQRHAHIAYVNLGPVARWRQQLVSGVLVSCSMLIYRRLLHAISQSHSNKERNAVIFDSSTNGQKALPDKCVVTSATDSPLQDSFEMLGTARKNKQCHGLRKWFEINWEPLNSIVMRNLKPESVRLENSISICKC